MISYRRLSPVSLVDPLLVETGADAALELPFSKEGDDSSEHGVRFARVSWARWHTGREFTRAVLKPQKVFACSVHVVLF